MRLSDTLIGLMASPFAISQNFDFFHKSSTLRPFVISQKYNKILNNTDSCVEREEIINERNAFILQNRVSQTYK